TLTITPPSMSTSKMPSRPLAGSTIRPPLSSRFILDTSRQEIENRHPHGHAVGHLFEDDGIGTVGHLGSDFDAAIHGPWMHDDDIGLGASHTLDGHAEDVEVLPQRRKERAHHALLLNPEQHHHVGIGYCFVYGRRHSHSKALDASGHQGGW